MLVKDIMSTNVHAIKVPGNRSNALRLMRTNNISGAPVVKEGTENVVGIVTRSDLIQNPDEEQIALIMTRDPIIASPDDDLKDIVNKMLDANIRRLPVVEDGKLVGIITSHDLVSKALSTMEINDPSDEYMIESIPTTWDKTPLQTAFDIMRFFDLKSLIALNEDGKMTGILTETDFIKESEIISEQTVHNTSVGTEGDKWSWDSTSVLYVMKNKLKFSDKLVSDVATGKVATVTTKTKVSDCAKIMKQRKIEQIPVTDVEGNLVGLIRANDLIKAILK